MPRTSARSITSILAVTLVLSPSSFAFNTPLSSQAVREAYFLGQRRDESMATFLNKYTKILPPPVSGPHIYSVTFFTPFALLPATAFTSDTATIEVIPPEGDPVSVQFDLNRLR